MARILIFGDSKDFLIDLKNNLKDKNKFLEIIEK